MKTPDPVDVLTGKALRRLRLRHLELLKILGTVSTVHMAATHMSLSQPAVSKMIGEMEDVIGMRLFTRGRRGIEANAQGRLLMRHAGFMINHLQAASDEIGAMRLGASGLLRVGSFQTTVLLPLAITHLRRSLPGMLIRIHDSPPPQLLAQLLAGELDCVVTAIHPDVLSRPGVDGLQLASVAADHVCVVASPRHVLARSRKLGWADVVAQRWVLPPPEALTRQVLVASCMQQALLPPVPALESLSASTALQLVRFDAGLLGLTRFHLAQEDHAMGLVRILPLAPILPLPDIALITRRDNSVEPEVITALKSALDQAQRGARPVMRMPGAKKAS